MLTLKSLNVKHSGNLGHHKKATSKDSRNRKRRIPVQKHRECIQQNYKEN